MRVKSQPSLRRMPSSDCDCAASLIFPESVEVFRGAANNTLGSVTETTVAMVVVVVVVVEVVVVVVVVLGMFLTG